MCNCWPLARIRGRLSPNWSLFPHAAQGQGEGASWSHDGSPQSMRTEWNQRVWAKGLGGIMNDEAVFYVGSRGFAFQVSHSLDG